MHQTQHRPSLTHILIPTNSERSRPTTLCTKSEKEITEKDHRTYRCYRLHNIQHETEFEREKSKSRKKPSTETVKTTNAQKKFEHLLDDKNIPDLNHCVTDLLHTSDCCQSKCGLNDESQTYQ